MLQIVETKFLELAMSLLDFLAFTLSRIPLGTFSILLPSQKWKSEIQILGSRSLGTLFVKEHSDSKSKYTEEGIIKIFEFLVDNIFVVFAEKVFQQIIGIPIGTNCAPRPSRHISVFIRRIQVLLLVCRKWLASQFNFTYRYLEDVLSIQTFIIQTLRIYSVRCIPLSMRSKTRRRATLLLPAWICSCQVVGTVDFALPFTTNVTILISILQTFRSWEATSHLRPPIAFLSHN